ncbi:MAG: hypothetical protein ACLR4Z_02895 [Butyricicoccaceae bacterium]
MTCVSMGNPHCVIFFNEDDVDDLDLTRLGPKFEHHPLFPERINTEFVERPAGRQPQDARLGARLGRDLGLRHRRVRDRRCGLPERLLQARTRISPSTCAAATSPFATPLRPCS